LGTPVKIDAIQKEALLREALAIKPDGADVEAIRTGIFYANAELGHDALAMAAVKPLLAQSQPSSTPTPDSDPSSATTESASSDAIPDPQTDTTENHAALLVAASDVSWHMGETSSSMQYLQTALRLARTSPQRTAWRQKLTQRQAVMRRLQANTARRPIIHTPLDQSIAVRARLIAAKEAR